VPACLIICRATRVVPCHPSSRSLLVMLQTCVSVGPSCDCVRCSIRHRRVDDLDPEHAGPRPISTGHSLSAYIAPVYRGPPVIFTFSRWPGGPRVLVGPASTTLLLARASLLLTFHTGTATAILRLRFRRHLSCRREGVSFAFRMFPVTPLPIRLPASL
jgi:hypothetical protein